MDKARAHTRTSRRTRWSSEAGFSMPEVLVATGLTIMISGGATQALMHMTKAQKSIWNRAQMHAGVRGTSELLQQEIGQAGRISLPGTVRTSGAIAAGARSLAVTSSAGMFAGEVLMLGAGNSTEAVVIQSIAGNTLTVDSASTGSGTGVYASHVAGEPLSVWGGFAAGVVPPSVASGSTGTTLKLFGDINSDGQMVYVEYTCDLGRSRLLRSMVPWNSAVKTPASSAGVLLSSVLPNPDGTPCFTYQQETVGAQTFVTGVAITLTVQTHKADPTTGQFQRETKALLNVSPRNVFEVWELASQGVTDRVQPTPASIAALLP